MVNWSAHTKCTLSFNCNKTTEDRTNARKVHIDDDKSCS